MKSHRTRTHIPPSTEGQPSLDELLGGGLPQGNIVLVSGTVGSGKTIFGLQYLVEGAKEKENGLYISFNNTKKDLHKIAGEFGWDIKALQNRGQLRIRHISIAKESSVEVRKEIFQLLKQYRPQRIVLDSLTMYFLMLELVEQMETLMGYNLDGLSAHVNKQLLLRLAITELYEQIKLSGATALILTERVEECARTRMDTIAEFHSDGLIILAPKKTQKEFIKTIQILEMKYTRHNQNTHALKMTGGGIQIGDKI
ncbi:MAG: hypothetical protein GF334_08050 [Candidatus Altiarchaeales archaeon]|nr:hypothetical protein [Candidatus Altiarchaeales archaeon]